MSDEAVQETTVPSPPAANDRLTVVGLLQHYCVDTGMVVAVEDRYSVTLKSKDQQTYYRRCKVGPEWMPFDRGWLDRCSQVHVRNREGMDLQRLPNTEEKAAIAGRVVELCFCADHPVCHVPISPGESARFGVSELSCMLIRCRNGHAWVDIHIFPE